MSERFDLSQVEVGDIRPEEIEAAVAVVARAMSTSPMPRAVIGPDPERCLRHLTRFFGRLYRVARHQRPLAGRGTGSLVLAEYTRRLDARGEHAYLETDKPENVALYGRFGFEVVEEAEVLGVMNWFMWREAGVDAPTKRDRSA